MFFFAKNKNFMESCDIYWVLPEYFFNVTPFWTQNTFSASSLVLNIEGRAIIYTREHFFLNNVTCSCYSEAVSFELHCFFWPFFMANEKTKNKKIQKCENSVAKKNVGQSCRWPLIG